jgi:hypothetical protein
MSQRQLVICFGWGIETPSAEIKSKVYYIMNNYIPNKMITGIIIIIICITNNNYYYRSLAYMKG